ncbi:C40 family peptidase [Candidatus Berkelbacteria bacterium]|nr:C40 family peptidase [Candidatus Berkelbacteria bacterium]
MANLNETTPETDSPEVEIPDSQESPPQNSYNQGEKSQWLRNSLNRINQGKQKSTGPKSAESKGPTNIGPNNLADNLRDNAKEKAQEKAKKEVAKIARQKIKQVIVQGLSKNPYVWGAIGIILLIILIIAIIFALYGLGGKAGKGPAIHPETAEQKEQATLLAALGGDKISNDKLVIDIINDEKERYQMIIDNAKKWSPQFSASATKKKDEFSAKLDLLLAEKDTKKRLEIKNELQDEMLKFEGTLPFGKWISEIAIGHKNVGSLNFCKIAKKATGVVVRETVACASFVSTVLWQAGVPNPIQASVDSIWKHSATRIVVDRPSTKSASYYKENELKLRAGDIIFWGNGACSPEGSVLFDHVGIYVGNGQAVDNSSSAKKILQRGAADRGSCRVFNGAKRYGANL